MFDVSDAQCLIKQQVDRIVEEVLCNRDNDNFYHKGVFNTQNLPDHLGYRYFPNIDDKFREIIFDKLYNIRENHCLYWFELENHEKANEFNTLLCDYRKNVENINYKKVPVKNNNRDSKILYLGVRQGGYRKRDNLTNIAGRILQHLGYYDKKTTQGLQLYEYARHKDFKITLKVIEFKGIEPYCLNVLEKLLAKKMKPLSGTH